ncbi:Nadh dehydrogenase, partial [Globisporangium splendens]
MHANETYLVAGLTPTACSRLAPTGESTNTGGTALGTPNALREAVRCRDSAHRTTPRPRATAARSRTTTSHKECARDALKNQLLLELLTRAKTQRQSRHKSKKSRLVALANHEGGPLPQDAPALFSLVGAPTLIEKGSANQMPWTSGDKARDIATGEEPTPASAVCVHGHIEGSKKAAFLKPVGLIGSVGPTHHKQLVTGRHPKEELSAIRAANSKMVMVALKCAAQALAQRSGSRAPKAVAAAHALLLHGPASFHGVACGSVRFFSADRTKDKILEQARKWQRQKPEDKAKVLSVQIDRSELKQVGAYPGRIASEEILSKKSKENDLVQIIRTMIEVKGPLTVSEFMQRHGYYMKKDVFGTKGDFTTAPEISQMFGELIGIWCVATWQQMGSPSAIKIVEMGPGRGSLMSDFLRAAKSFPPFYQALDIHMVEISPALRKIQQENLGCEPIEGKASTANTMQIPGGPTVQWHEDFGHVPQGPSLMILQELFDALPVHQGWCERLVDVDYEGGEDHFRFVLSPGPTPATRVYIGREKVFDPNAIPAQASSAPSMLVGEQTANPIKRLDIDDGSSPITTADAQIGDKIEISPMGIALAQDIAKRISQFGGGALLVDYGHDRPSELSLRGIKNHEFVSVLREPGDVDLSIDVDFATLRRYATAEENVKGFGPIGQGAFLKNMGIEHRLAALLQNAESEEVQEELFSAYERLVEPDQMGSIFKAMALTHVDIGQPVGFEVLPQATNDEQ